MSSYPAGVSPHTAHHAAQRTDPGRRTLWEEGREPGRQVVVLGVAAALSALALDLWLGGDVGLFFDLCFVALCLALALAVRPSDFFVVGVLPPLLMIGVMLLLELTRPGVLGHPTDGAVQSLVTGLADHSGALVAGYVLALVTLGVRQRFLRSERAAGTAHATSDGRLRDRAQPTVTTRRTAPARSPLRRRTAPGRPHPPAPPRDSPPTSPRPSSARGSPRRTRRRCRPGGRAPP